MSHSSLTTILMLSANPKGNSFHRLEQEKRDIAEGLQRSRHRDQFRLETKSAVRPRDLQRAMLDLNPRIVHFSGESDAEAGLVFEDESGQPKSIAAAALAGLFSQFADQLQCVVLNACYSEAQAEAIAQHIPYVIGMSQAIDERAAIEFAVGFYDALGAGRDIQFAYQLGCSAAQLTGNALKPVMKTQPSARSVTIAPTSSQPFSPAIYNASTWVERSDLTKPLVQILQGGCRVLTLTGMTGIGKTALAERLITELRDERRFARLNLDEGGVSAEFSSSGAALLQRLGEEPTLADQQDPQNLLAHLLQLLRSQPHRVQIDSIERLLEGDDRQGWSEFGDPLWLNLLQQLLGGNECQSQIILTTQELPGELESIGSRYPQRWCCEPIRGLSEAEQRELFAKRGLSEKDTDYLRRIGKLYDGHPLVLRVIAEDIKACGGNVQRYWQQGRFAEQEANRPANLSRRKLQLEVKRRVKEAIDRLPADALQLLCRSAVYSRPVPEKFWLALLQNFTEAQQQGALNLLKSRGLILEELQTLKQHFLIRSVAYDLLQANSSVWKAVSRQAAGLLLTDYLSVEDWSTIADLTDPPIDSPKREVDGMRQNLFILGKPLKVFLCHSNEDKPTVKQLYAQLISIGVDPWLDEENLLPGQNWRNEIEKAVRESHVVIVCLSHKSINKTGFVQKEIRYALDVADEKPEGNIYLIPARLEECVIPDRLNGKQYVDLFQEHGFNRLIKSLQACATQY